LYLSKIKKLRRAHPRGTLFDVFILECRVFVYMSTQNASELMLIVIRLRLGLVKFMVKIYVVYGILLLALVLVIGYAQGYARKREKR
jgi:hypothetical protein